MRLGAGMAEKSRNCVLCGRACDRRDSSKIERNCVSNALFHAPLLNMKRV